MLQPRRAEPGSPGAPFRSPLIEQGRGGYGALRALHADKNIKCVFGNVVANGGFRLHVLIGVGRLERYQRRAALKPHTAVAMDKRINADFAKHFLVMSFGQSSLAQRPIIFLWIGAK